jgi:hypothetical protein
VLRSLYANFETSGSLAKEYAESRHTARAAFCVFNVVKSTFFGEVSISIRVIQPI